MKYILLFRFILFLVLLGILIWILEPWPVIRNSFLWMIMIYLIIGSIFGGAKRLLAEFTGRTDRMKVSKLGISWATLTMWFLVKLLGIRKPGSPDQKRD